MFLVSDCVLYAVGKPVFHKMTDMAYGAWLKDPQPSNDAYGERVWTTNSSDVSQVLEYTNKTNYRNNIKPKTHIIGPLGFVVIQ